MEGTFHRHGTRVERSVSGRARGLGLAALAVLMTAWVGRAGAYTGILHTSPPEAEREALPDRPAHSSERTPTAPTSTAPGAPETTAPEPVTQEPVPPKTRIQGFAADTVASPGVGASSLTSPTAPTDPRLRPRVDPTASVVSDAAIRQRERAPNAHPDRASKDLPPPRDPDQTPFLRPPAGQLGRWSTARDGSAITRGFRPRQRATISLAPVFAALPTPLRGRGDLARAGGGASLSVDLYVARWLALHVDTSHTQHPVTDATRTDDSQTTTTARSGRYGVSQGTLGLLYLIDVGRVVPSLEAGAGVTYVTSPPGLLSGQRDRTCTSDSTCDLGLACVSNRCVPRPLPHLAAGLSVDVRLGKRWAVGGFVRYYAALTNVARFPVYLVTGLRATFRF